MNPLQDRYPPPVPFIDRCLVRLVLVIIALYGGIQIGYWVRYWWLS